MRCHVMGDMLSSRSYVDDEANLSAPASSEVGGRFRHCRNKRFASHETFYGIARTYPHRSCLEGVVDS